jgi:GWxTD domain-containing protein
MSLRLKLALAAACFSLAPAAVRADKLDKDDKRWLDEARPLMLPDEEKTFRDLKDKADRLEFEKIFWARRDPDLDTPENEYQAIYNTARAEADRQFKVGGQAGSATDCGRVYLLLGKPDDMKQDKVSGDAPSLRPAEVWTYKDRPGQTFAAGQVQIAFEKDCQLPQGARLSEQLNKVAESKVLHPNLAYGKTPDGHIVKLVDQLPKPSPAQALLKAPRQDFPMTAQSTMMLRSPEGATYVAGLVRATGVPHDAAAGKSAPVNVVVQALDAQGKVSVQKDRQVSGELAEDGSVLASYGMTLRPGKYTVNVGVLDAKSGKGSVSTVPVEVPDLTTSEVALMPLVLLQGIQEGGATPDPKEPMADFVLGPNRLVPSFDNVFPKTGALSVIGAVYNGSKDAATGKASLNWGFSILKDGKPVAKTDEQVVESETASPSIGPVPLAGFAPGKYVVQLHVRDNVAKKDYTKDAPFEVK